MRRKRGAIIPLEEEILTVGVGLRRGSEAEFHGFKLAKQLQGGAGPTYCGSSSVQHLARTRKVAM